MCIVSQVPLLLVEETGSPEVEENLRKARDLGICGEMSTSMYSRNFKNTLKKFLKEDYDSVLRALKNYKFKTNGAEIIAEGILKRIKKCS
jgi:FMN-dependent NADH-azoreductase